MATLDGSKYRVIDGGFATELTLTHKFNIDGEPLWSAGIIGTHADVIKQVHLSFMKAGADLIETATYQASIAGFTKHLGVTHSEAVELLKKAVNICRSAVDEFWQDALNRSGRVKPLVVGSLGPYGAHLADSSEYSGNYVDKMSTDDLLEWHRPNVKALLEAGVDMLAFETIPALKEALALIQLLKEYPSCTAWISFSCKDGQHTCHGDCISEATEIVSSYDRVIGIGINCTRPMYVSELLRNIPDIVKRKTSVLVYPNSGEDWTDSHWPTVRTVPKGLYEYVGEWMTLGATWIGGCCCVSPIDISLIRQSMQNFLTTSSRDS